MFNKKNNLEAAAVEKYWVKSRKNWTFGVILQLTVLNKLRLF